MELVIGQEYAWDGQYVKLVRLEGDEAVCETRFASTFRTDVSNLEEKPPRREAVPAAKPERSIYDECDPDDYPFGRHC